MNDFKGTLIWISQTDTVPQLKDIANFNPSAENASFGTWKIIDASGNLAKGKDMRVTKEKFVLCVPPESEE